MAESTEKLRIEILMMVGYGDRKRTYREVCSLFHEVYPNRPHITPGYVSKLVKKFNQTGSVKNKPRKGRPQSAVSGNKALNTLLSIHEDPHLSTRELGGLHDTSQRSVVNLFKKEKFHPYKIQLVQELEHGDFERRLRFCDIMMGKLNQNPNFCRSILFTDEATFSLHGFVNKQTYRYWSQLNPHWIMEGRTQRPQKVNVWAGILDGHIIGPFFIDGNLTSEKYLNLLREGIVPAVAAERPISEVWFQQDGAPSHYGVSVRQYLDEIFQERWIGRRGSIEWPARSPDLAPCDFFLWGHLKNVIYRDRPLNIDDLKVRINSEMKEIEHPTLINVVNCFQTRLQLCIDHDGHHFEHLMH